MKIKNFAALSLALAMTAGAAFAADSTTPPAAAPGGPHGHHDMFEHIDTNHDGVISKAEWRAKGDKMFSDIDTNHDGKITPDEMKAHHEAMRQKWEARKAAHQQGEGTPAPTGDQ